MGESIGWSAKFGEYENGDPELHHLVGTLYAQGLEFFSFCCKGCIVN